MTDTLTKSTDEYMVTRNACKLCTPLGACLAFRGIEGAIPFLHGSQGCATYIRRYMISHFREPMDIASSSFAESSAIFGGRSNLFKGIKNVIKQYNPRVIGIATTCLSETIGDDVNLYINELENEAQLFSTELVHVSTPSYTGTHADGYFHAVRETVAKFAEHGEKKKTINIIPNMVSPADIRYLKQVCADFGAKHILFPDYSETLDGTTWNEYQKLPIGGTPVDSLRAMGSAAATVEFTSTFANKSAGAVLEEKFNVPFFQMPIPIGIQQSDKFFELLKYYTGNPIPEYHVKERGRLVDAYVDGHKYLFGKKAVIYGDQDFVVAMAGFLSEIGIIPAPCASGANTGKMAEKIKEVIQQDQDIEIIEKADFVTIEERTKDIGADLLIGNSKAQKIAKKFDIPLVRIGFPIHDRFGGARLLHLGYSGTQQLFDRIVNAIIEKKQSDSPVGYSYI